MIVGGFEGVNLRNVVGYKISANWTPNNGFQGFFYVYVWDRQHPGTPFTEAVDMGADGEPKRGSLILDGSERTYKFNKIDLISAQVGATRRFRYRLLEFRYDEAVLTDGDTPVEIENKSPAKVMKGGLKDDYKYSLGGEAEHLLGFRTRLASAGGNVARFSALRNNANCFLEKMIKANNEKNGNKRISDFTVTFAQGDLLVTQDSLSTMYVDESFGYLQGEPQPSLFELVAGDDGVRQRAVSIRMDDYTQRDLLEFDVKQDPTPREVEARTIETATFVFNQGHHQDLKIT